LTKQYAEPVCLPMGRDVALIAMATDPFFFFFASCPERTRSVCRIAGGLVYLKISTLNLYNVSSNPDLPVCSGGYLLLVNVVFASPTLLNRPRVVSTPNEIKITIKLASCLMITSYFTGIYEKYATKPASRVSKV